MKGRAGPLLSAPDLSGWKWRMRLFGGEFEVTLIHNGPMPMSKLEEEGRTLVLEEIQKHGVTFLPNTKVEWLGIGAKGTCRRRRNSRYDH